MKDTHHLREASLVADHPAAQASRQLRNGGLTLRRVQSAGSVRCGLPAGRLNALAHCLQQPFETANVRDPIYAKWQEFRRIGARLRAESQSASEQMRVTEKGKEHWKVQSLLTGPMGGGEVYVSGSKRSSIVIDLIEDALKHRFVAVQTHKCEELPGLPSDHPNFEDWEESSGLHMRHSVLIAVIDNAWVESVGGRRDLLSTLLRFHHSTEIAPEKGGQTWLGKPFVIGVDMRKNPKQPLEGSDEIHARIDSIMEPFLVIPGKFNPDEHKLLGEMVANLTALVLGNYEKVEKGATHIKGHQFRKKKEDSKLLREMWTEHDTTLKMQREYLRLAQKSAYFQSSKLPAAPDKSQNDELRHIREELLRTLNYQTRRFLEMFFDANLWDQHRSLARESSRFMLSEGQARSVGDAAGLRVELQLLTREYQHLVDPNSTGKRSSWKRGIAKLKSSSQDFTSGQAESASSE